MWAKLSLLEGAKAVGSYRLAAMVETKSGTPFQIIASLNTFGHAKNAMDDWASELKTALLDNP